VRRNGVAPPPHEQGWKDVVYVGPNERVELVMRFHAARQMDPDSVPVAERKAVTGKYVMHCHNLVHEDHDMMTQFETQPAAAAAATGTVQTVALGGSTASMSGMAAMTGMTGMTGMDKPSMMVQWELQA
jgi:hypothetical protein